MQLGVMITHGGPHPAEKWADRSANDIVQIDENAPPEVAAEGYRLRAALIDALLAEHVTVQESEREKLVKDQEHLVSPLDPKEHAARAVEKVLDAGRMHGTWAEHFNRPEVRAHIHNTLHQHFGSSMDIERSWHADRTPDHPVSKAYRKARDAHGPHHVHMHHHTYR